MLQLHYIICAALVVVSGTGKVLELSDRFLEVYKDGLWFVMFYAPWCGHCKKLEPIWNQVSQSLYHSPVRIGRVDCTRFTEVAVRFNVKGFPTILFMKGDTIYTYKGDRVREEMVDFALRLTGPEVRSISSCTDITDLKTKHEVFFLYVGEETDLFHCYSSVAKEYQITNFFYAAPSTCMMQVISNDVPPVVFVVKDLTIHRFHEATLSGNDKVEFDLKSSLNDWVNKERFAEFSRITQGNLQALLLTGKYIVMAVLEETKAGHISPDMHKFREMLHNVISTWKEKYHEKFVFGWIPQSSLANSIAMARLPTPSLLVLNSNTYKHHIPEDDPHQLTSEAIAAFLDRIVDNTAPAYGGDNIFYRIYRMYFEATTTLMDMWRGNPVLTAVLFGLPLGFLSLICYSICCADILDANEDDEQMSENEISHEKKE